MNDTQFFDLPAVYPKLEAQSKTIGFTMPSDRYIGSLLKTLVASKPGANILELGTGMSLSLAWMVDGLDKRSQIITIDNDPELIEIAQQYFGDHPQVEIVCSDGGEWLANYEGPAFDLVFADTWPGKYYDLDKALELVKVGGFYVIDDMLPEPNWPEGHHEKAAQLIQYLEDRPDFLLTKMNWSTGIIMAVKINRP